MYKINEVIIVEGRYDKNRISQIFDATVLITDGFSIYNNKTLQELLKRLAIVPGLIILTDSDHAGFQIRNFIKSIAGNGHITDVYIPDIYGKERRKRKASKEQKLGVEGIDDDIIVNAFKICGVNFDTNDSGLSTTDNMITKADFYSLGLYGRTNSRSYYKNLLLGLNLPANLSVNDSIKIVNNLFNRENFIRYIDSEKNEIFKNSI